MDDRLKLAALVGVFDGEEHYQRELARLDHRHKARLDYYKGAGLFSALFACYILMVLWIGTP